MDSIWWHTKNLEDFWSQSAPALLIEGTKNAYLLSPQSKFLKKWHKKNTENINVPFIQCDIENI
jgi:cellobiose-specific phosphotransferase system component IIB